MPRTTAATSTTQPSERSARRQSHQTPHQPGSSSDKENSDARPAERRVRGTKRSAGSMSATGLTRLGDNAARAGKRKRTGLSDPGDREIRTSRGPLLPRGSDDTTGSGEGDGSGDDSHGEGEEDDEEEEEEENENDRRSDQDVEAHGNEDRESDEDGSRSTHQPTARSDRQKRYYDPEQSMVERRKIRKDIRELQKELNDSRGEYLSADSDGLRRTVHRANEIFRGVKQTSEATLDSRLLAQAGELGARRAANAQLGGAAAGVNIDEFVAKAIRFMRRGPTQDEATRLFPPRSTQREVANGARSYTQRGGDSDSEKDAEDIGDEELNWEWLGRAAVYPYIRRPGIASFLLGPLSVQKKARKATQRVARQRLDLRDAVRPDELELAQIERNDNRNLAAMCVMINNLLSETIEKGQEAAGELLERRNQVTDDDFWDDVMNRYRLRQNGGVCLFHFAFNPRDFGQTVENLFYISFLIRDGRAGISADERGYLGLLSSNPSSAAEIAASSIAKSQGVFHLDHETWKGICDAYKITESIIPHREIPEEVGPGTGWYG